MTEVMVNIIATDPGTRKLIPYDRKMYGNHESTSRQLNVNKVGDTYTLVIRDDIFERMDPEQLMENVCNLMKQHIKDDIGISINYIFVKDQDNDRVNAKVDYIDAMMSSEEWENMFPEIYYRPLHDSMDDTDDSHEYVVDEVNGLRIPTISGWNPDEAVLEVMKRIRGESAPVEVTDSTASPYSQQPVLEPETDTRAVHHQGWNELMPRKTIEDYWDYDDDDSEWDLGESRVMKRAKHPKRDIDRHGIILVKNKKAMIKDYHLLLPIVREFIPGNSKKIRRFQKEVAKAWVKSYSMTYAEAEEIEKEIYNRERKSSGVIDAVESVTGRIFGKSW